MMNRNQALVTKQIQIGLRKIHQKYHGLITPLIPHRMWEITIPRLERTLYAQTGLILKLGPKFNTLMDNGTTNNGKAFSRPALITRQLHALAIKYNVTLVGNEYYTCQFAGTNPQVVLRRVNDMVTFLLSLDALIKRHT